MLVVACIFGFPNKSKGHFILVVFAIYLTIIIVKSMVFAFSKFLQSASLTEQYYDVMCSCFLLPRLSGVVDVQVDPAFHMAT